MSGRYHLLCVVDVLAMLVLSVSGVHKIHIIEVSCKLESLTKRLEMMVTNCMHIFHSHFRRTSHEKFSSG